jgi:hypothetical protein
MGCVWEAIGYMGCPLGRPSIPRYLAQYLALVSRAHKADSGRKVSEYGPGSVLKQFNTFLALPLHSHGHVSNDAENHPPRNRSNPSTPGGRPQGFSSQRNTTGSAEGQSTNTPTPYPRIYARSVFANVLFTPLSVYTAHCNCSAVRR